MYTQFYGLREKPFSLSPDPRYLFLADSHREALAHLLYGIEQGEGFIAITGEVGTGKTTLCRTLLQRIEPGTEVAFIFNPQLSPEELLQAVCAEFGLDASPTSRRELLDQLNRFLLAKKAEGRRVLLIIDEAQNLPMETLEQIRMLSNLETDTSKLVQIILVGQPELDDLLETHQLRQLRQRISVRWRLKPLSALETRDYVRHRLRIAAGAPRELLTELALREVHRRSRGVPRVVNLLCDRALLAGYAAGARSIGLGIVTQTDREIRGGKPRNRVENPGSPSRLRRLLPLAAVLVAALAGGAAWQLLRERPAATLPPVASPPRVLAPVAERPPVAAKPAAPIAVAPALQPPSAPEAPLASPAGEQVAAPAAPPESPAPSPQERAALSPPEAAAAPPPERSAEPSRESAVAPPVVVAAVAPSRAPTAVAAPTPPRDLPTALANTTPAAATAAAFDALLARWQAPPSGVAQRSLEEALAALGEHDLDALALRGARLSTLRYFDRPALVALQIPGGGERVLLLEHLETERARLSGLLPGAGSLAIPLAAFEELWTGKAWVVWRDFESLPGLLRPGVSGAPVAWLQHSLGRLGFYQRLPTGQYDEPTVEAVQAFQASRQLRADGRVGPVTKMALYEALGRYVAPQLVAGGERG